MSTLGFRIKWDSFTEKDRAAIKSAREDWSEKRVEEAQNCFEDFKSYIAAQRGEIVDRDELYSAFSKYSNLTRLDAVELLKKDPKINFMEKNVNADKGGCYDVRFKFRASFTEEDITSWF